MNEMYLTNIARASIFTAILVTVGSTLAAVNAKDITIGQKNKTFVLDGTKVESVTIKLGDTIHFGNQDPWFHNIFSLSELKTFDLGSYPQGESRPVTFDKPGVVEIECAIHPNMSLEVTVKQ